jgi:hypothetical protein
MSSFDQRVEQRTQMLIDQALADSTATLSSGQLQSHADYKYHCGIIAGLRLAKDFLGQALVDIQKG